MIDRLRQAFDRPAITTDIIVGFPGETDEEFQQTLAVVDEAQFVHIHAFSYSPRPGTAAARWTEHFVHGPVVNQRIDMLRQRVRAAQSGVPAAVPRPSRRASGRAQPSDAGEGEAPAEPHPTDTTIRHGRCERYFSVFFEGP